MPVTFEKQLEDTISIDTFDSIEEQRVARPDILIPIRGSKSAHIALSVPTDVKTASSRVNKRLLLVLLGVCIGTLVLCWLAFCV